MQNSNIKLSIILPVFRVESFIEATAKSLFCQHDPAVEYIFVNDCSPDKSFKVLQNVLHEYPACQAASKLIELPQNGGVENARMTGLSEASGEYIWFVDSDDLIAEGAIAAILDSLQKNPVDYLAVNINILKPGEKIPQVSAPVVCDLIYPEQLFASIANFTGRQGTCLYIVKRQLTVQYPHHKTQLKIAEDYVMHCCWSIFASSAAWLKNPVYGYVIHAESVMNHSSQFTIMRATRDAMQLLKDMAPLLPCDKRQFFSECIRNAAVRKRMEYFAGMLDNYSPDYLSELLDAQVKPEIFLFKDLGRTAWGLRPVMIFDKLKFYKLMYWYLKAVKRIGL